MRSSSFGRLLALFLIVPIADLALLIWVGGRVGFWPTVGLIALTALAGSWLARRQGWSVLNRVQAKLASGALPGPELIDGLIILVSAALLLTPGILTDAVGFLGLLPPTRALIRNQLHKRFKGSLEGGNASVFVMQPPGPNNSRRTPIQDAEIIDEA